jgi:cytochrome c oxidase subunit IV
MAKAPEKKLRWDRIILALLLLAGLIAGVFVLVTR